MVTVLDRFLKYVKYSTQSDPDTGKHPSTPGQLVFAASLVEEMNRIGLEDVSLDGHGYVMGFLPANTEKKDIPVVGFIAHMDTSPDFSGENVQPRIVRNYSGGDIMLNEKLNIYISSEDCPELSNHVGDDIVVTDGTTLLGADDKAGVAEIMTAMEYLVEHPEIKHGKISVCFTPDEEIGEGTDFFDVKKFGAKFAYTMDGGEIGGLEFENFNAAYAKVVFKGKNYHPGYAKNKMLNSILLCNMFLSMLPKREVPEKTEGYEGFFHVYSVKGSVERSEVEIIIRDFDQDHFNRRKIVIEEAVKDIVKKYGPVVELDIKDQYSNMIEKVESVKYVIDIARQAMISSDIKPVIQPIRGGTDGVKISFMGIPTPNLFAGGMNMHGKYEYVPVSSMEGAVRVIVKIAEGCMKF